MYTKESLIRYKKDTNEYLAFSFINRKFKLHRFPFSLIENREEEIAYLNAMAAQTFLSLENTLKLLRPKLCVVETKKNIKVAIKYLNNNNQIKTRIVTKKDTNSYFEDKKENILDLKIMYAEKWIEKYTDSLRDKLLHGEKCKWNIDY